MYTVSKAHNMESYTNQTDELYRQANEIKHPPSYSSCYETMMEQLQQLFHKQGKWKVRLEIFERK